jgi:hypothetical protein
LFEIGAGRLDGAGKRVGVVWFWYDAVFVDMPVALDDDFALNHSSGGCDGVSWL